MQVLHLTLKRGLEVNKIIKGVFYAILPLFLLSCTTTRNGTTPSGFIDASLVADQRLELEKQKHYISELERVIQSGAISIREAREYLGELEKENIDLRDWLQRVDTFVRRIAEVERSLDDVQLPNSSEDAGEG